MSAQRLRWLPGRYALEHHPEATEPAAGWLWAVRAPDGLTVVRPDDGGAWCALWSGDTAHAPDVAGMLAALLVPLAAAEVPVMVASTWAADVVLVPAERRDDAAAALGSAGHLVG